MLSNHTIRKIFLRFLFSLGIAYLITMGWEIFISHEPADVAIYFLVLGIPAAMPLCVLIFFVYYFLSGYILKKLAGSNVRWVVVAAGSCIYMLLIAATSWLLLRGLFYTFADFMREANFTLIFTVVTVSVVIIARLREVMQ